MVEYYGTIGPSCTDTETLRRMFAAGMTGVRINLSHGSLAAHEQWLAHLFRAAERTGISPQVVMDLQGPELRTSLSAPLLLSGEVLLTAEEKEGCIPVPSPVLQALSPGDRISLDDSRILLAAEKRKEDGWLCSVLQEGTLLPHKSLAILGKELKTPVLTSDDLKNLDLAEKMGITGLMQPFVRSAEDLKSVRRELERRGLNLRVTAKIETVSGIETLDQLIPHADMICIARGDLGNAVPLWKLPALQREITLRCRKAGVPFMVVTQMLQSMTHAPVPTRAEVNDIYLSVLSGASAVMLTGETAAGEYPAEAMEYLVRTGKEAERDRQF